MAYELTNPSQKRDVMDALGLLRAPLDIVLLAGGQSNQAGWTVRSGDRQLTVDDIPDARIRIADIGKGADLIANGDFQTGSGGWTGFGCTLAAVAGKLELTATSAGNPYASFAMTGLTVGATYELTADVEAVTTAVQLRMSGLTESGGRRTSFTEYVNIGRAIGMRARFVATATAHDVRILSNSGATPTGTVFARVERVSAREVLSAGVSYPKAVLPIGAERDFANIAALGVDTGFHMAKRLLDRGIAKRVTIIPAAIGGTGFYDGRWCAPSGNLFTDAVARLTAVLADNPLAVPVFSWVQGEQDATAAWTPDQYITAFSGLLKGLRAVPGAEAMPAIVGEMVPEYVNSVVTAERPQGSSANHRRIDAAHRRLPQLLPLLDFVEMELGGQKPGEAYHYSASGARRLGQLMGDAVFA